MNNNSELLRQARAAAGLRDAVGSAAAAGGGGGHLCAARLVAISASDDRIIVGKREGAMTKPGRWRVAGYSFVTVGPRAVEKICSVVYQAPFFDVGAYKTGTGGLHSHGAMGTDAAMDAGARRRQLQSE